MTTREEISRWFDLGVERGSTYMLVVCDTFDHEDYPNYAASDAECLAMYNAPGEMQRVMEVYNLMEPKEPQLNERRCKRLPPLTGAQPAPAAPNGYKLVPLEPTEAMLDALNDHRGAWADNYRAMLAAAPAAQPADSAMEVLRELVRLEDLLNARSGERSADRRRQMTAEYDAAKPVAVNRARALTAASKERSKTHE